jgi:hypothetical protein
MAQNIRPGHLTAHQTARLLGTDLAGVRKLVQRGHLERSGGPRQPWYAVTDVTALVVKRAAAKAA